jgi:hypothetical protein
MFVAARLRVDDQPSVLAIDVKKPAALWIIEQAFFFHMKTPFLLKYKHLLNG